jgi:uncharacterized protein (TIGR02147 family)
MASIFDSQTYREFILSILDEEPYQKGGRTRLAEHLGVYMSFISTVLSGKQDFSLEHGIKIANFFKLDAEEREWLLLLISLERAGSTELKAYFQEQLDQKTRERRKIKAQIKEQKNLELTESDLSLYYGAWHTIAVHMCIHNPKTRDSNAIASSLSIAREQVQRSLKTLERLGFAKQSKGLWVPIPQRFHVSKHSPALRSHLTNWRNMAIHSLDDEREHDLHYSAVISADQATIEKIRLLLLEVVKKSEPIIEGAKDEQVLALNLDFFRLGR